MRPPCPPRRGPRAGNILLLGRGLTWGETEPLFPGGQSWGSEAKPSTHIQATFPNVLKKEETVWYR